MCSFNAAEHVFVMPLRKCHEIGVGNVWACWQGLCCCVAIVPKGGGHDIYVGGVFVRLQVLCCVCVPLGFAVRYVMVVCLLACRVQVVFFLVPRGLPCHTFW